MSIDQTGEKEPIRWSRIVKAIKKEECILCIGPEVFRNSKGLGLEEQIVEYLRKSGELNEKVIPYPDGLFYFKNRHKKYDVLSELEDFYQQPFPEAEKIFDLLVKIPFKLIILLTPDGKYADIAEQQGLPIERGYYAEGDVQPEKIPSLDTPLVYNLLGSFEKDTSVILSYDDLFKFLKSYFKHNRMPQAMQEMIPQARNFVCLGLPFEKWYMQLLLRILNLHAEEKIKYASEPTCDRETLSFYDRFKITFVPRDILEFTTELYDHCEKEDLLRRPVERPRPIKEAVSALIADTRLEEALNVIESRAKLIGQPDFSSEIAQLKHQTSFCERERNKGKIGLNDYLINISRITDSVLNLADRIDYD